MNEPTLRDVLAAVEALGTLFRSELAAVDAGLRSELAAGGAGLRAEIAAVDAGLRAEIAAVDAGLRAEIAAVDAGLRSEIAAVDAGLRSEIAAGDAGLRLEIATLRTEQGKRFDGIDKRLDRVDITLAQHGQALHELRSDLQSVRIVVDGHTASLGRIERRQNADSKTLDDHERRITALERRT